MSTLARRGVPCDMETLRPERPEANSSDWEIAPDVLLREEPDEEEEDDGDDKDWEWRRLVDFGKLRQNLSSLQPDPFRFAIP
jgi:hypothetical protein